MNALIGRKNGKMTSNPIRDALFQTSGSMGRRFERLAYASRSHGAIEPHTVRRTARRGTDRPADAAPSAGQAPRSAGKGDVRGRMGGRALPSSPAPFSTMAFAADAVSCVLSHS